MSSMRLTEAQRKVAKEALLMTEEQLAALPASQREVLMKFREAPEFEPLRKATAQKAQRKKLRPGTQLKIKIISYILVFVIGCMLVLVTGQLFYQAFVERGWYLTSALCIATVVIAAVVYLYNNDEGEKKSSPKKD